MTLFRRLNRERGLTIVLVTHDVNIAAWSDRVVTLKDGLVVDDRTAGEVVPAAARAAIAHPATAQEVRA